MLIDPAARSRADLCPGLLRPFSASDGSIIRLRAPGGRLPVKTLVSLLELAADGAPFVQLTSRGNLQLRALPDPLPEEFISKVMATGLVPSPDHERVRNIGCSPLTGLLEQNAKDAPRGRVDIRPLALELDRGLCEDPELAQLPGRFLFGFDDGRHDLVDERFDLLCVATSSSAAEVRLGGHDRGLEVPLAQAPATMIELARAFQKARLSLDPVPWHLAEMTDEQLGVDTVALPPLEPGVQPRPGQIGPHAVVGAPLGHLDDAQIMKLAEVASEIYLTPWRQVVVPGGADSLTELAQVGFITHPEETWSKISACTGLPGCAKSAIATIPLAFALAEALDAPPERPIHISGCDRQCGVPKREHVEFVAPASLQGVLSGL